MKNKGIIQVLRFVRRHIFRNGFKSAVTILLAVIFTVGLTFINLSIVNNEINLAELYKTVTVDMNVVRMVSSSSSDGFIYQSTIDKILETGFIRDYYTEGTVFLKSVKPVFDENSHEPDEETYAENCYAITFDDAEEFAKNHERVEITYFDGYDEGIFSAEWEYDTKVYAPVLIPETLYNVYADSLETDGADAPRYLEITVFSENGDERLFEIAGYYSGEIRVYGTNFIIPTSALLSWFEHIGNEKLMLYSMAKFSIYPDKNQDIQDFRIDVGRIVSDREAGTENIKAVIWDLELREVAEPMENNIQLLRILYPVVLVVSILIAAGVCVLFTMLSAKDAAIMHVQGTSKARVRLILTLQMLFTCIIGLIIGLLGMYLYMHYTGQANMNGIFTETLKVAGLYLAATILGSSVTSVFVTNKHPIELLQVKE